MNIKVLTSLEMEELDTWLKKREVYEKQLKFHEDYLKNLLEIESPNLQIIRTYLKGITHNWKGFYEIQFKIEELNCNEKNKRVELQERYINLISGMNQLVQANITPQETIQNLIVKIPQITQLSFAGIPAKWPKFLKLFKSVIHDNPSLSSLQKLQCLKYVVEGKAERLIESLENTDENYAIAINILKEKNDPRRKIIKHWTTLKHIPALSNDTPEALANLLKSIKHHFQIIKYLGESVASWGTPIVDLLLSKISPEMAYEWEWTLVDDKQPAYKSLMKFLEKKAEGFHSNSKRSIRKQNAIMDTEPQLPPCVICGDEHHIYTCFTFESMNVHQRIQAIKDAQLCSSCLEKGHSREDCVQVKCIICQREHHTFLHIE